MAYCPCNIPRPVKHENGGFSVYRRVLVKSTKVTPSNYNIIVLYHVRGATLLSHCIRYNTPYNSVMAVWSPYLPSVCDDAIQFSISLRLDSTRGYELVLDVDENQPVIESVEEISESGVSITVYNADGVVVCRNTPKTPANSAPEQTDGLGEMTSEPIDGTGEMKSEPIDGLNTTI